MTSSLTPKQASFVREYLVDKNATRAAIRAGYSAKTAEQSGPRLLGNVGVASAIAVGVQKQAKKLEVTAERVLEELASMAFASLDVDDGTLRAPDKLKALELLGKNLKLFTDKLEVKLDSSFADALKLARERAQRR